MGYEIDPVSDNCYPGTAILINKFNILDEKKLNETESTIVSFHIAEWSENPKKDSFDFSHYKAIHSFLFSDLYDWAGEIRTVNISKKGTLFCRAEKNEEQAELVFKRLKECNFFRGLNHEKFTDEIVDFYCSTNELHPFREGNGRTQRVFLTQLIRSAGYEIAWSKVDMDILMIATIQSAQGVTDLLKTTLCEAIKDK